MNNILKKSISIIVIFSMVITFSILNVGLSTLYAGQSSDTSKDELATTFLGAGLVILILIGLVTSVNKNIGRGPKYYPEKWASNIGKPEANMYGKQIRLDTKYLRLSLLESKIEFSSVV